MFSPGIFIHGLLYGYQCMVYVGYCCSNDQAYNFNWEILSVVIVTQLCYCLYNGSMVPTPNPHPPDKCTYSGHQLQVRTARFPVFCSKLNGSANLIFTNWNYDINLKLQFCPPPPLHEWWWYKQLLVSGKTLIKTSSRDCCMITDTTNTDTWWLVWPSVGCY